MTNELQTIIRLKYPDPDVDFKQFANALPEMVVQSFFEQNGNTGIKRQALISYWNLQPDARPSIKEEAYRYLERYEQTKS